MRSLSLFVLVGTRLGQHLDICDYEIDRTVTAEDT